MPDKGNRTTVLVSIREADLPRFREVEARLRGAGLQIDQALETLGTLTGSVATSKLASLRAVEGVDSVEVERTYQLPPHDADVQ